MHQCLQIQEILSHILKFINTVEISDKRTTSLLAIALTCRSFCEPGLDALWERIDGPDPLIRCMGVASYNDKSYLYTISEQICSHHLTVLGRYGRRVRIIANDQGKERRGNPFSLSSSKGTLDPKSWRILYDAVGEGIVPQARQVAIQVDNSEAYDCKLRLLLGPKLQNLSLMIDAEMSFEIEAGLTSYFAHSAPIEHPSLTELELSTKERYYTGYLSSTFYGSLRRYPIITTLRLPGLPLQYFRFLADLKHLKELEFAIEDDDGDYTDYNPSTMGSSDSGSDSDSDSERSRRSDKHHSTNDFTMPFPRLEVFHAEWWDAPNVMDFLDYIHPDNTIKSISLIAENGEVTTEKWQTVLSFLSQRLSPKTLCNICVKDVDEEPPHSYSPISSDTLKQFARFRHIVVFECHSSQGFDLDDQILLLLAQNWPSAKRICFSAIEMGSESPRNTLRGLSAFSEHCLMLEELTLPFDTEDTWNLCNKINSRRVDEGREFKLDVQSSPLHEPIRVTIFLSSIFPDLCCIDIGEFSEDVELSKQWKQVEEGVQLLAEVRRSERAAGALAASRSSHASLTEAS